ncbi:hypothetical protein ABT255_01750 [Streptomyces mirabilis]|uniref:hypothetical protein n=1 Tax=Streptomyces mirabilis TaxID=68239 RepID=UPI00332D2731
MSVVAISQETLPFDFEVGTSLYSEEAGPADIELCKAYFLRWAGAFGSGRPADQPVSFGEFRAAARRLAQ